MKTKLTEKSTSVIFLGNMIRAPFHIDSDGRCLLCRCCNFKLSINNVNSVTMYNHRNDHFRVSMFLYGKYGNSGYMTSDYINEERKLLSLINKGELPKSKYTLNELINLYGIRWRY